MWVCSKWYRELMHASPLLYRLSYILSLVDLLENKSFRSFRLPKKYFGGHLQIWSWYESHRGATYLFYVWFQFFSEYRWPKIEKEYLLNHLLIIVDTMYPRLYKVLMCLMSLWASGTVKMWFIFSLSNPRSRDWGICYGKALLPIWNEVLDSAFEL